MRALLILILTIGLGYGGFLFWQQTNGGQPPKGTINSNKFVTPNLSLQDSNSLLANLESVLGESISSGMEAVGDTINNVTGGKSEPIINEAISNFQKELSKLPEDQVKKIQYHYCKRIVEEYEKLN
ncbi:MAG: hypothetical protein DPW11_03920 [bacterium]|nr:hypothetical protein [Candidatus Microgenomates bacterium CPR3]MCQ3944895.1 hypothetical protein [bacterium]RIK51225.1 MAG: hypothetical protein DCC61_03315 [Candidatus Microgenomates bacterium]